jgi:hypothetical protein
MITAAKFTNVNGMSCDFNDQWLPFNSFDTEVDVRMTEREKALQHGLYPSSTYLGKRLFHCDGDILELSSEDYWTRRLSLIAALTPRPHIGVEVGTLELTFDGWEESVTSACTLDGWPDLPLGGASPSRSPFQINWKAFDPRLYGAERVYELNFGVLENFGGREYDKSYPKEYVLSGNFSENEALVLNYGNIETYPVVVFSGPLENPQLIAARSDGSVLSLHLRGYTLTGPGNTVTVDLLRRTAVSETGANVYKYAKGSDWFAIEPSEAVTTNVALTGKNGEYGVTGATITVRNAYMI